MSGPERYCRLCSTPGQVLCPSCARAGGYRWPLPTGFWDTPELRDALARCDFGPVFRAVRAYTHLSQPKLAVLIGLPQPRISAIENGRKPLTGYTLVARVATALDIPPALIGFPEDGDAQPAPRGSGPEGPDVERVQTLLSRAEAVSIPRVGLPDVGTVEAVTDALRRATFNDGGALWYPIARALLDRAQALAGAARAQRVRDRLLLAVADLANVAGWMAGYAGESDTARMLWTTSIDAARKATGEPLAVDLAVSMVLDLADHTRTLGSAHPGARAARAREALRMLDAVQGLLDSGEASAGTRGYTHVVRGWCYATLGDVEHTTRAMGTAADTYATRAPEHPPWTSFVTEAEIARQHGHSLYLLSLTRPDHAPTAVAALTDATTHTNPAGLPPVAVAHALPWLASAHFQAGDLEAAVAVGHRAIDAVTEVSPTGGPARLLVLDRQAARHDDRPDVADLRAHISTALAGAGFRGFS